MFAAYIGRLGFEGGRGDVHLIRVIAFVRSTVSWGRQALCGLRGHVMVRHFEPARLSLRCLACGAETPGWTIDVRPAFRLGGPARPRVHRLTAAVPPRPRRQVEAESRSVPWRLYDHEAR